jgi:hypothetical protein
MFLQSDLHTNEFNQPYPRTHDIGLTNSHIPKIGRLCQDLNTAVNAIWPRRHHTRYKATHVLLLSWEEDDLGVLSETKRLKHVFQDRFNYQVQEYQIPSTKPDTKLKGRIFEFLQHFDDENALLIVYYAGHASPGRNPGGAALWYA